MKKEITDYSEWIGKPIDKINIKGELKQAFSLTSVIYNNAEDFFGMNHKEVSISINEKEEISLVSIAFPMLLSQKTFDKMILFYGEPNRILALDKLIKASKSEEKESNDLGFHQDLTKKQYSTKSVTFREKPTWIIWEKENFELSIQQFYNYNVTRVIFKKNKII